MFTGIVEELGVVDAIDNQGDAVRLTVRGPLVVAGAGLGDSIAVNGCCLTIAEKDREAFTADVMQQTLTATSLGALDVGDRVNLERAVTASTRLGGHMVQGHVDATGEILARTPSEHWEMLRIGLPARLARYVAAQGSVAVDGVSLTVVEVDDTVDDKGPSFTVSLIPETLARTGLGSKQVGDRVNLEVDVIAKYVERLLGAPVRDRAEPNGSGAEA